MYTLANMTSFAAMLLQEINLGGKTENPVDYTAAFKEQLKQLKEAIQSNSAVISDSETLLESISKLEQSVENKTILQIWQASQDPANPAPGELNELITQMSMVTNQLSNVSSQLQTQQSMMNADYEQRLTQGKKIVAQVFDLIKNITKKLGK
jgi:DNA repair ATPase RecN